MVADSYANRKQVVVKQRYNQVPETAWVSQFRLEFESVGDRMPAEWELAPDKGLGPSETHGRAAQPEWERSTAMVRRTWGQYVAVYPRLQLTSHTQPTENKVWELYFYKKCVRSFIEVVIIVDYVSAYICIRAVDYDYTTVHVLLSKLKSRDLHTTKWFSESYG